MPGKHVHTVAEVSSPVLPDLRSHTLRVVRNIDGTLGVEDTTVITTECAGKLSSDRGRLATRRGPI